MKSLMLATFVILTFLAISLAYEVKIRVIDVYNQPVENASITIESVVIRDPYTDCNGYLYAELPQGNYRITARKGDSSASTTVYINSNREIILRLDNNYYTLTIEPINGSVLVFRNGCYKTFTSNKYTITGFKNSNDKFELVAVERSLVVFEKWEYDNRLSYETRLLLLPNSNLYVKAYFKEINIALEEILKELNEIKELIKNNQQLTEQKLNEILNRLNNLLTFYNRIDSRLSNIEGNISQIYLKLSEINNLINSILNKLSEIKSDTSEIKNLLINFSNNVLNRLSLLENLIISSKNEIISELNKLRNEASYYYSLYLSIISDFYRQEREKEGYCLKILNEDAEKIFRELIILIENCGSKNLTNLNVLVKYNDKAEFRTVSLIKPNEIKYLRIPIDRFSNKFYVNVFAFNENVSTSKSILVSFEKAIIDIEVPEVKIENDKEIEFYVKLVNYGKFFVEDYFFVETPKGIYSDTLEKVKLGPFEERYVKVNLRILEEVKNDFEIKLSFAGNEKIAKIKVAGNETNYMSILIGVIILLLLILFIFLIFKS
ncbi:MAG: hypothetical protein QXQ14_03250 [Candidatus Aenigmatarchaeota archaeon]